MRILVVHNRYLNRGGEDAIFEAETALLRAHGHFLGNYQWVIDHAFMLWTGSVFPFRRAVWEKQAQVRSSRRAEAVILRT